MNNRCPRPADGNGLVYDRPEVDVSPGQRKLPPSGRRHIQFLDFWKGSPSWAARVVSIGSVLLLLIGLIEPIAVQAETSPAAPAGFAYGVRLEATGDHLETAVSLAARLGLQWLAITLDWGEIWAKPQKGPDYSGLQPAMDLAEASSIPVLVSVTHAPDWALTSSGPNPDQTAQLVRAIIQQYPSIKAVELFPGANTIRGWGAAPDPGAYMALLRHVQSSIDSIDRPIQWIAGG